MLLNRDIIYHIVFIYVFFDFRLRCWFREIAEVQEVVLVYSGKDDNGSETGFGKQLNIQKNFMHTRQPCHGHSTLVTSALSISIRIITFVPE